jgi:hypothetical protein
MLAYAEAAPAHLGAIDDARTPSGGKRKVDASSESPSVIHPANFARFGIHPTPVKAHDLPSHLRGFAQKVSSG